MILTYPLIILLECIPDYRNSVIVAKNPLAARRATSYAERLRLGIAVIHGEAKVSIPLNNASYIEPLNITLKSDISSILFLKSG